MGLLSAGIMVTGAAAADAQVAFVARPLAGPGASITTLGNVALARDGSGGLVFLAGPTGATHVYASVERHGVWGAAQRLDGGLAGSAAQPVIAAAEGGRLIAAFTSGGQLYAVVRRGSPRTPSGQPAPRADLPPLRAGFGAPQSLAAGASNPALAVSMFGTAYLSFAAPAGGASDVYAARLDRSSDSAWQVFAAPFNLDPGRNAGATAVTRPRVAVASDGSAVVAWAEEGADGRTHVAVRRVSRDGPSTAPQDLTLSALDNRPGVSADSPTLSTRDVGDFGQVAFRQSFIDGARTVSRTLLAQQLGSRFEVPTAIDPLHFPTQDAADGAQVGIDGSGSGVAVSETTGSRQVHAVALSETEMGTPTRLDAGSNAFAPQPSLAVGGAGAAGGVSWLQGPASAPPGVHIRAYNGAGFETEAVISRPALGAVGLGPTDSGGPLSSAADRFGDVFVAFLQGAAAAPQIMVGGLANPPSTFHISSAPSSLSLRPLITWSAAGDPLGLAGYQVHLGGRVVATTTSTSYRPPRPLPRGIHTVTVVAVDRFGQTTESDSPLALLVGARPAHRPPARRHATVHRPSRHR